MAGDPFFDDVVFLSGFEGADTSTSFVDESSYARTVTGNGNAQIDTAQFRHGASSLLLDGTGDYITSADAAELELGSGDFTLEGSWRWNTNPAVWQFLVGKYDQTSDRSYAIFYDSFSNNLRLLLSSDGTSNVTKISYSWSPTLSQWYDIAADWDGTTYRLYIGGSVVGTGSTLVPLYDGTSDFLIGAHDSGTEPFDGWADEVRITKGVARYAGAYTPAVDAFPRAGVAEARVYKGTSYAVYEPVTDERVAVYKGTSYAVYEPDALAPRRRVVIMQM